MALALISAAAALACVAVLEPIMGRPYYFPAFAAIILPAIIAGGRYGVIATLLFAVGYVFWFLPPRGVFAVRNPYEVVALAGYTVTGCFVAAVGGALRRAYTRVREQHRLLDLTVAQREDLLHALTHDIRSPLSVITMNAGLLARTACESDPAVVERRAAVVQRSARSIEAMLGDLAKVVALESGQVVLERTSLALAPFLAHVKESLAESVHADRVVLSVADDVPSVHVDPQRFERIIANLVANALKYSTGVVTVSAARASGAVVVSVRDAGPGIEPDDLPHVFEKFYRGRGLEKREGLGLGLYISRLLAEAHGGRIWVESATGAGSTFHVEMPVAPAPSAVEVTAAAKA